MNRLVAFLLLLIAGHAAAETFTLSDSNGDTVNGFDCQTGSDGPSSGGVDDNGTYPVDPGDTIIIPAGTRKTRLVLANCRGASGNPIILRNASGGAAILDGSSNTGNERILLRYSEWITIDGTQAFTGQGAGYCNDNPNACGIRIVATSALNTTSNIRVQDLVANADRPEAYDGIRGITIKGVYIDATANWSTTTKNLVGISCHATSPNRVTSPGAWRENYLITRNYITYVRGEGMYCGNNPNTCGSGAQECVPNRNMEISYNTVIHTGADGINPKSWYEGTNSIHHNYVRDSGMGTADATPDQDTCIQVGVTISDVYSNFITGCGGEGIAFNTQSEVPESASPPFTVNIYNNVVHDVGKTNSNALERTGIRVHSPTTGPAMQVNVYNNTVAQFMYHGIALQDEDDAGILANASNNLVVGTLQSGASYVSNQWNGDGGSDNTTTGNITGSNTSLFFTDYANQNFKLISTAAAVGSVTVTPYSTTDIDGVARPQGTYRDAGAYEYEYPPPPVLIPIRRVHGVHR